MDSKPIAIIIAIVVTIGMMGGVAVFSSNIISGTSTSNDLTPKTLEVIQIKPGQLVANIQLTNQGTGTLKNINGTITIGGNDYDLINETPIVEPFKTIVLSGSVTNTTQAFEVYPGNSVLLTVEAKTTSGDIMQKIYKITVK